MSSQNPRNPRPRRRIAGERRPVRPDEAVEPSEPTEPSSGVDLRKRPAERADEPEQGTVADRGVGGSAGPAADTRREPVQAQTSAPAETPEPAAASEPGEERTPRGAPGWRTVAVLGALALILVLVAGVLALGVWRVADVRQEDAVQEARRTAPAAAERAATAILSYDHDKLDADAKTAGRYMTPTYRKQYLSTFDELVRPNATKVKAVVTADVKASAVTQADADRVSVLLYVNQSTTSTANGGEPQLALNRVQMTMVQRDGRWLVSDITSY